MLVLMEIILCISALYSGESNSAHLSVLLNYVNINFVSVFKYEYVLPAYSISRFSEVAL